MKRKQKQLETPDEWFERKMREYKMAKERTIYTKKNYGYTRRNFWIGVAGLILGILTFITVRGWWG